MQDKRWIDELAKKQKPGDEFAELVRQLVSKETGKSAHVYPSKDGGIDVHEADSGWGWQCKFVAERPREVTKKAIAIVNDEFKVLTRNLQDNSPKTGQVQYGIWYEHGAVTRYTFATNLMLPNLHSRKLVIKEIEAKFQNLKNKPGLSHLKDIEVLLWDGQDIAERLGKYPSIKLHWFGTELPQGVEYFQTWKSKRIGSEHDSNLRSFRAYLFEAALPYQPHPDEEKRPNPIWRRIEASETPLFVVHGRAGLGKSRLAVEIAELATIDSWLVFVLVATTTTDHILSEISQKYATHKCLLFVDYAENCASLQNLLSCLERLKDNGGKIKMIATVRSLRSLGEQIQDEDGCDTVELASSSDASSVIMKGILGVKLQDLESLCNGIPVFAAFLRLLDARGLTASIDQLRTERDFQKWLRRHVAGLKGNPLALAQLCAMLPASGKQMDNAEAIASPLKNERLRLQRDGWLSYEQKNLTEPWQVAHHLIADGAIIELLSDDTSYAPHAVDLLKFAATSDTRKQVLQSLRRVVGEPAVSKVNWSILFERLRDSWQGWVGKIALSGLIEGSRLIEWLTNMQFTTNDLTVHADVRGAIRSTLRDVAQAQRKLTDIERDWVTATFHCASEVAEQAFILSHWLRADQKNENLSALARSWLALNGGTRYAGYVYAAWLESGGDIEVARPMFDDWLTKNNTRHDAVKPIVAWLDATSDVTSGRLVEAVRYWITGKARAQSKGAAYLYRAWLKHGGEFSEIGRQLSTWLSLHSTSFGAQHVFNAWLERIHDNQKSRRTCDQPSIPVELDSVVRIWLRSEEHRTQFRAYYTYVSWLKAKGTPDPVLEPIVQWLTAKDLETAIPFAANFDAGRDVLTSWLLAGLDPKIVQEAVGVWLTYSDNSSRDEARFIFVGWLAAGGAPEFIREPLKAWLENIPLSSQTEQVLSAWLANGGAVDEVKSYVSRWMVEMPVANLEETDYLVLRWRKAGGERVAVETAVAERAKHFSVSPDVYWNTVPHPIQDRRYDLLASRLKRNEDPIDVFEGAVRAAVNERKDEDTRPVAQILRFWMERHGISGVKILQPEILNWLDHYNLNPQASYVIPALLEIGVIDDQELFVRVTDLATARLRENMGTRNKGDFYVLRGWVRSHRQVEPIADLFRQWLLDNSPLSEKKPKNLLSHSEVSNGRN